VTNIVIAYLYCVTEFIHSVVSEKHRIILVRNITKTSSDIGIHRDSCLWCLVWYSQFTYCFKQVWHVEIPSRC